MYGPPPDPRQVLVPVTIFDVPEAYLGCVLVGAGLSALALWRRPPDSLRYLVLILGQTVILTMPLLWFIDDLVYGAFPTIDKEGSLLFYLDGVHRRMLLHPLLSTGEPAAHLIGVHTGHLWVTAFFDLFLSPLGAFNAQALLYPALAWFSAWLLLRDLCAHRRMAFVLAFAWGMGLHVFRDLNWYTIEKAAIFWIALFAWALHRAWSRVPEGASATSPATGSATDSATDAATPGDRYPRGAPAAEGGGLSRGRLRDTGPWPWITGLVYLLMTWNNLYFGMVGAVMGATALVGTLLRSARAWRYRDHRPRAWRLAAARARNVGLSCAICALAVSPLSVWQILLLHGGPSLGDPERFLHERAALDSFTLLPFRWNRLEPWRALNLVVVGLALFGAWFRRRDPRVRYAVATGSLLAMLSLGPYVLPGVPNPLYMGLRAVIPGFWRIAKPEVFFHGTWLLMCGVAAIQLARVVPRPRTLGLLYLVFVVGWVVMVRSHPAYPDFSLPVESRLDPDWAEDVFR